MSFFNFGAKKSKRKKAPDEKKIASNFFEFNPKKAAAKQRGREMQARGKAGEFYSQARHAFDKVERTGRGHDYKIRTINPKTWKEETQFIEVKTGKARLSPLQKKEKKKKGKKYKVERFDLGF